MRRFFENLLIISVIYIPAYLLATAKTVSFEMSLTIMFIAGLIIGTTLSIVDQFRQERKSKTKE